MEKNVVIISIIVIIVIGGLGTWYWINNNQPKTPTNSTQSSIDNTSEEMPQSQTPTVTENTNSKNYMIQNMKVEVLQEGSGTPAQSGDMVTVNYTGTLTDGTKFDSSLNPGRTPFQFTIGPNCRLNNTCVIEGWNLGVTGMKVGEKRKLTIPSELGYGAQGAGGLIPPNATLLFEIELLKIN